MKPFQFKFGEEEGIESLFVGRRLELETIRRTLTDAQQRAVIVRGLRGSGMTALLAAFWQEAGDVFPAGRAYTYGFGPESPVAIAQKHFRLPVEDRALLVIDDAQMMTAESLAELQRFLPANPGLRLLMTTSEPLSFGIGAAVTLTLGGLSQSEYFELLSDRLPDVRPELVQRLWASTAGHPLAGDLAARAIRDNTLTWDQLFEALEGHRCSGIFGPDNRPIETSAPVPSPIVVAVSNINADVISMLRSDPSRFRSLSPRKFEEIVAELLSRMGYEVELTPPFGDGGFDMYAARNDRLGRFLFLVECKRYVPPDKVGVQVVRSLYGVVQQKHANAGIIATTSFFTRGAKEFQQDLAYQIQLRDYLDLQKWLRGTH